MFSMGIVSIYCSAGLGGGGGDILGLRGETPGFYDLCINPYNCIQTTMQVNYASDRLFN